MANNSTFLGLPPELRVRIYESALCFEGALQKPLRASAWRECEGHVANTSLLSVCKLIHQEARDVFYEVNTFKVSYNHVCTCENRFPYPVLDERVREVEIYSFLPRVDEPQTCKFCSQSGYGIIDHLIHMPKLQSASIAFEDIFGFSDFAPDLFRKLSLEKSVELSSDEVGLVEIKGLSLRLEIQLPSLRRVWSLLHEHGSGADSLPGEQTMRIAIEYLQFEANTYNRTARALLPFFLPEIDNPTRVLRFKGLPGGGQQRAEFTLALVAVLSEIFEDDGGAASVDWVYIDSRLCGRRWKFSEEGRAEGGLDPFHRHIMTLQPPPDDINAEPVANGAETASLSDAEEADRS